MEFAQGRPPDLTQAADREAQLIERYRGRIAGFDRFAGMDFVGLAWARSADAGSESIVRYIDALYRRSTERSGYADLAVRTWFQAPLEREEFAAEPYLATHVRDFMLERSGGEFSLDSGVAEIAQALLQPGRPKGTLAVGGIVAAQPELDAVVTVVGAVDCVENASGLTLELEGIPRLRG